MPKFLFIGTALSAMLLAACGGGGEEAPAGSESPSSSVCAQDLNDITVKPSGARYFPSIASSDLALGQNRFAIGLRDNTTGQPVVGAELRFHLYCFDKDGNRVDKFQVDSQPLTVTTSVTQTQADGTARTVKGGELGLNVAQVDFSSPGKWGIEVTGELNGEELQAQTIVFDVREKSQSPAIGAPAPRSVQPILKDVPDIRSIDTSAQPIPEMHDRTIADAVTSGKPTVIAFATPAFCVSQLCSPAKDFVDALYGKYKEQANFVHVEPYFLQEARDGTALCPIPVVNVQYAADPQEGCPTIPAAQLPPADQSWNISTEPWVFIVDTDGNIAAKFESAFSEQELEDALKAVLSP